MRLNQKQFSLRNVMIATGSLGALLGFFLRDPRSVMAIGGVFLFLGIFGMGIVGLIFGTPWFFKLPLRTRLIVEFATLLMLLTFSSLIWTPTFYTDEANRCKRMARLASGAATINPEVRVALDREAAWFSRRASSLGWRGWWLGLTMGPSTRDDRLADLIYELGTLESIEKHERRVTELMSTP